MPVGWFADRTNRVRVLSLACAIWSAATMACGFAATYPQLVVARMTVGFGEAGGVPPSYALITDIFPPGRRGTALGIYNLGPPIGAALGIAFGASIAAAFNWRDAFIAIGIGRASSPLSRSRADRPRTGARRASTPARAADGVREGAVLATRCACSSRDPTLMLRGARQRRHAVRSPTAWAISRRCS